MTRLRFHLRRGQWVLMASLLMAGGAWAGAAPPSEEAAKVYQAGEFARAREIYESMLRDFKTNPELDYNLANTCYKLGDTGRAILWYERALRLRPFDGDIRDNLFLVRSEIKIDEENPLEKIFRFPKISWLLWGSTGLLWIWAGGWGVLLARGTPSSPTIKRVIVTTLSLWGILAGWGAARYWDESKPWGIIVVKEAQIRSGPTFEFPVGATAPEGLKILILEERDGWVLVGLPKAGIKGWTPLKNAERIQP